MEFSVFSESVSEIISKSMEINAVIVRKVICEMPLFQIKRKESANLIKLKYKKDRYSYPISASLETKLIPELDLKIILNPTHSGTAVQIKVQGMKHF